MKDPFDLDNINMSMNQDREFLETGKELFNTPTGKKFLEKLRKYLEHPVSPAFQTERYACVREGQNEIIRFLIRLQQLNYKKDNKQSENIYE